MTLRVHPDQIVATSRSPLLAIAPWWKRVRIGDIAEVVNGAAFKSDLFNNESRGMPLVRIRDVGALTTAVHYDGRFEKRHLVEPGDLLVGMDGDFRIAKWGGQEALLNQRVCRLRTLDPSLYDNALLGHCVQPYLDAVNAATSSTTVKHLSSRTVQDLPIPLPPRAEQERIVAAIEEHLSSLDAAERSLVAAESRMARLRQALIDDSIEGPPEQLDSLLREPLRNGVSARASATGTVKVVTLTAVTRNEFIDSHTKMIEASGRISDDLWMEPGDLFVQRSNSPELVGTASQYRGPKGWATFPDLLIRVRLGKRAIPDYVELVLHSSPIRRYLQGSAQGIAGSMPKISQPIVASTDIPLPSVDRQRKIVNRVSAELEAARRMGREVTTARARQRSLRRSILAAVFSGQLVPQDPDDEPASALLDRIRAGRLDDKPGSRRRHAGAPT